MSSAAKASNGCRSPSPAVLATASLATQRSKKYAMRLAGGSTSYAWRSAVVMARSAIPSGSSRIASISTPTA